jgi:hypothetical protein
LIIETDRIILDSSSEGEALVVVGEDPRRAPFLEEEDEESAEEEEEEEEEEDDNDDDDDDDNAAASDDAAAACCASGRPRVAPALLLFRRFASLARPLAAAVEPSFLSRFSDPRAMAARRDDSRGNGTLSSMVFSGL